VQNPAIASVNTAVGPAPRRRPGLLGGRLVSHSVAVNVVRLLALALMLGIWQIVSGKPGQPYVLLDEFYISTPLAIVEAGIGFFHDGILLPSLWITIQETLGGFAIGGSLGFLLGLLLGTNQFAGDVFRPFVLAFNGVPRLALVPLFMLWFGLGIASKIALVTTIVFFLVFYNTYAGVRDVNKELVNVLQLMGASSRQIHMKVTLPSAMTWIVTGLRVSVPFALLTAVTAEMIASNRGMGYLIVKSSGEFYTAGVFASIVLLAMLALFLNMFVNLFEKWVLQWKE
jgi:NitT/TauT family transport system permease protein